MKKYTKACKFNVWVCSQMLVKWPDEQSTIVNCATANSILCHNGLCRPWTCTRWLDKSKIVWMSALRWDFSHSYCVIHHRFSSVITLAHYHRLLSRWRPLVDVINAITPSCMCIEDTINFYDSNWCLIVSYGKTFIDFFSLLYSHSCTETF